MSEMKKVTVPNISDGTMKEMFVGKDGQLIDPELVKAEEQKIADEAAAKRNEENEKRLAVAKDKQDAEDQMVMAQLPLVGQRVAIAAKIRKEVYDAHIRAGFTPDQAMQIVLLNK